MAFQSTALIDSSIPRGEIKKIDRPSAFQCHSSQQLYVKLKTQLKFKLFQSDGAPATYVSLNRTLMKIGCSHSISKANGTGFKTRLPPREASKRVVRMRVKPRPRHRCLASDDRNSPAVLHICSRRWKEPLRVDLRELCSLLGPFRIPQRSKGGSKYWNILQAIIILLYYYYYY